MLSRTEAAAIETRVGAIERATGVQIVTALVRRSGPYPELAWKAFAFGVAVGALLVVAFDVVRPQWVLRYAAWANVTPILALGGASAVLALIAPAYGRLFLDRIRALHEVRHRAQAMFLERHVFKTDKRDGVLVFASLFERRVRIVADVAFDGRIDEREWRSVIEAMTPALVEARAAAAFARGLDRVEAMLVEKGFHGHDALNELPDKPIVDRRT